MNMMNWIEFNAEWLTLNEQSDDWPWPFDFEVLDVDVDRSRRDGPGGGGGGGTQIFLRRGCAPANHEMGLYGGLRNWLQG